MQKIQYHLLHLVKPQRDITELDFMIIYKNIIKWMFHDNDSKIRDMDYEYAIRNLEDYGIITSENYSNSKLHIPSWIKKII